MRFIKNKTKKDTMKAAIIRDYGTAVEIAEIEKPSLKEDSVIIEVYAASLNPIDNILRAGYMKEMMPLTFPHVMGYDVSGVVVKVGKGVESVKIGDSVFARQNQDDAGAIAEYARIKENELAIKPASLSHVHAASVPLAGLTAWQALMTHGKLQEGCKVLIHAGSGGVGTNAIQIAKHFGAFVATTTSSKNTELVQSLGADLIIDYKTQKFQDQLSEFDLVIDMLGGETMNDSFKVLKKGGALISIKGQDTDNLASKYGVRFEWFFMSPDGKMLEELGALISAGSVKPIIDTVFPLDQADVAYERLATGRSVGKIVVEVK
ncbi:MAG: NADPH:quinone reductase-like Zn-dependent oxidoreductase [Flavobacteriaceae bacterium]|jgi:NADPH:quinone reductase-like Zn-dependent oxidoreductase